MTGNAVGGNGEGGVELEIRNAAVEISGNTLNQNGSNGVTLNNRTNAGGKIIIKNNTIQSNQHYGIRCAGSKRWTKKLWKKVIKRSNNAQSGNKKSNISPGCHAK